MPAHACYARKLAHLKCAAAAHNAAEHLKSELVVFLVFCFQCKFAQQTGDS